MMASLLGRISPLGEKGFLMVETIIAVGIGGTAVVVFFLAIATGSQGVAQVDRNITISNLAQSQMEFVHDQPYLTAPTTYPTITPPEGYSLTAVAEPVPGADDNIQKVTVTVFKQGDQVVLLEDFKLNNP